MHVFFIGEILFTSIIIPIMKAKRNPKIQIEHSHSIVDSNVTQKNNRKYFDLAFDDNNVFDVLDIYPRTKSNIFYKKNKIHVFKYQKNKSKIMNHIKYRHFKKSLEHLTNDKFQSPYIRCNSKEINSQFLIEHHIQADKVQHHVKTNEHVHKSMYIDIYNKQM